MDVGKELPPEILEFGKAWKTTMCHLSSKLMIFVAMFDYSRVVDHPNRIE
jgi:hypothetical protein